MGRKYQHGNDLVSTSCNLSQRLQAPYIIYLTSSQFFLGEVRESIGAIQQASVDTVLPFGLYLAILNPLADIL